MNKELLDEINETINKSLANSNEDAQLQMKILKNNINAMFAEYEQQSNNPAPAPVVEPAPASTPIETLEVVEEPDTLTEANMKSILIVDDSSMIRNYLERIFINDYNITMAVDGNDAIEKIQQNLNNLNIILLDLVMPKADGFFVLEHIQKYNVDIPVIIISGDTSKESIEKAFDYGVVDMIKKPFDSDIIKDKIARYSK
jgi:CheY-like chemotaxis protein